MVHVPDSVLTIKDFAGHVARLLELNLHGGNAEPPQILLDGFLVPHDEEVREVLRDDEVIDVEPAEPGANGDLSVKRQAQASLEGPPGKRPKAAPVMALGWQPQSHALPDVPDAEDSAPKIKGVAAVNGHKEVQSKAIDKAKALALATCESTPPSKEEGRGIFVGGLPVSVDDKELRNHFEAYGAVQDATVVLNQRTGKSKGFGFVEFRDAGIREAVMQKSVQIQGKVVEVKVRQAKGGGKGSGKEGKGGKDAGKGGKGGKNGKGKGKIESKEAPKVRTQAASDDSDSDDEDDEEEKASPAVGSKQKNEEVMTEEMKQMAALGLPVSFKASEQQGGSESEEEDDDDDDE